MNTPTTDRATSHYAVTLANQRRAADPTRSVWASANAGAGKTKVLIDRIARLLLAGARPEEILAVTYTKAAAAEMQTRLFATLGGWTVASDADLVAALGDLEPGVNADAERLKAARRLFARALEAPGGLQIQTIHSFCTAILQRFPLEAGLTPGFRVLDEIETGQLRAWALERAMHSAPEHLSILATRLDEEAMGQHLDSAWRTLT
nr:UvrD-helicase domain-containing protein [Hyphomonadaceae bacterium]